jgi:hypothetical protein
MRISRTRAKVRPRFDRISQYPNKEGIYVIQVAIKGEERPGNKAMAGGSLKRCRRASGFDECFPPLSQDLSVLSPNSCILVLSVARIWSWGSD